MTKHILFLVTLLWVQTFSGLAWGQPRNVNSDPVVSCNPSDTASLPNGSVCQRSQSGQVYVRRADSHGNLETTPQDRNYNEMSAEDRELLQHGGGANFTSSASPRDRHVENNPHNSLTPSTDPNTVDHGQREGDWLDSSADSGGTGYNFQSLLKKNALAGQTPPGAGTTGGGAGRAIAGSNTATATATNTNTNTSTSTSTSTNGNGGNNGSANGNNGTAGTSEPTTERLNSDEERRHRITVLNQSNGEFGSRCETACKSGEQYVENFVNLVPQTSRPTARRHDTTCNKAQEPEPPVCAAGAATTCQPIRTAWEEAKSDCEQSCRQSCQLITRNGRDAEISIQRRSAAYQKKDDAGCTDAALVVAADAFMRDDEFVGDGGRHYDRRAFFHCIKTKKGGDVAPEAGDFIRIPTDKCEHLVSKYESTASCSITKTLNTTLNVAAQAGTQILQTVGQNSSQMALARVQSAQQKAAAGINIDQQREAINSSADMLQEVARAEASTAGGFGALAAVAMWRAQEHNSTISDLENSHNSSGTATVGATNDGKALQGSAHAIVGLTGKGASNQGEVERAEDAGDMYAQRAQEKHEAMKRESLALGAQFLVQAAQHSAQALTYNSTAETYRNNAGELVGTNTQTTLVTPPPGSTDTPTPDLTPPPAIAPLARADITNGQATATADTGTNTDTTGGTGITPGPAGGGQTQGSLRDNSSDKEAGSGAFVAAQGGGTPSAGGGAGGGGDGAAKDGAADAGAEDTLATHERAKNMMLGGAAGGSYASASRSNKKNDTGMDLSAMLSQLLGKKDGAKDGKESILDVSKGGRNVAGNSQDGPDIGDRNGNLFERASKVVSFAFKQGKLR